MLIHWHIFLFRETMFMYGYTTESVNSLFHFNWPRRARLARCWCFIHCGQLSIYVNTHSRPLSLFFLSFFKDWWSCQKMLCFAFFLLQLSFLPALTVQSKPRVIAQKDKKSKALLLTHPKSVNKFPCVKSDFIIRTNSSNYNRKQYAPVSCILLSLRYNSFTFTFNHSVSFA